MSQAKHVQIDAPEPGGITVTVEGQDDKKLQPSKKPLQEQVKALCDECNLSYDTEENYYVLVQSPSSSSSSPPPIVRSEAQLSNLKTLSLVKGSALVTERLRALRDAENSRAVPNALKGLLVAVYGDPWMADEVIERGGIETILQKVLLLRAALSGADVIIDLAMACLCELFQFGNALKRLEDNTPKELSANLFRHIFEVLFLKDGSKGRKAMPRATLSAFQYFISMLPACPSLAHQAALGISFSPTADASEGDVSTPMYPRIVRAAEPADSNDEFEQNCASAVLSAMVTHADDPLAQSIKREVSALSAEVDLEDPKAELVDSLVQLSMRGSAHSAVRELEAAASGGGGDGEVTRKLESRLERIEQERENLKGQLRLAHERMKAMVKFIKVENALLVEQSLDSIVKSGWDSIHWKRNYNLLHYCSECVEDPAVVELVGLFATNIDQKEDGGKRPIDFARDTGRQGVIKVLERLRKTVSKGRLKKGARGMAKSFGNENDGMQFGEGGGGNAVSKAELLARFKTLKEKGGLTKPLQKAIETVLEVGWGNVEWPSMFTAMHLAAKVGTVESIELLVAAGAEIAIADDWRLTPMDYAAQANRTEIITCLQNHLQNQQRGGGGFGGGGQGGGGKKPPREPDAEERKKLVVPDGLRPELQRACEAVIKKGWSKIKWPHDFTALHLAGRLGSTDAATLLIKASAWPGLELKDDKGMTPLDYAKEKNHENLVKWFQEFQASHGLVPGQGGGGGGTGGPGGGTGGPGGGTGGGAGNGLGVPGGPPGRAGGRSGVTPVDISGLDLAQERLKAMERDPEELGLNELRSELEKLRKEKNMWQLAGMKAGPAPDVPAAGGPLDEEAMIRYLKELQAFGREAVAMKLMESEAGGGLNLDKSDAIRALAQLDFVCKIANNAAVVHAAGGQGGPGGGPGGGGPGGGGGDGDGTGKGKGKGKKGGPPAKGEAPKAEGEGGKKGKKGGPPEKGGKGGPPDKGKGKGPGGPPGKGAKGDPKAGGKGGAKGDAGLSKPKITPKTPMKPIWWTRLILGQTIKEGETIWDEVQDDHELLDIPNLEQRFSKNATAPKEKPKKDGDGEKKEEVKLLRIITDPNVVVGKEASLKQLPPAQDVAKALEELDESEDTGLTLDWIRIVRENACPTPAQMKELAEAKKAQPNVPLALPEQYMWVIGNMPAYQQRLECWEFTRTYKERQEAYSENLAKFETIVQCFTESDFLPSLLGLVLAVGNYLNGGTNRGQADGFDIETLGKLEAVKDAQGKDIRHYIFSVYFNTQNDKAAMLIDELAPCFANVSRRLSKDSDGTEKLNKSARIVMEDFDQCVAELQKEFETRHETMQMILQYFEDPADPFKLRMPGAFSEAKESIDDLVQLKDHTKDKYSKLLNWFKIAGMKSSEFCMIWDNLFIPPDMIVNKSEKIKKDVLIPTFCQPKPLNVDDLMVLWEFKDPSERRAAPRAAKKGDKKVRDRRKTVAKKPKAEPGEATSGGTDAPAEAPAKGGKAPGKGKAKGKAPAANEEPATESTEAPAPQAAPPAGKGKKGKGAPAPATSEEAPAPTESGEPAPAAGKGKKGKGGPPGKGAPPPTPAATTEEAPAPAESPAPAPAGKGKKGKGAPPAPAESTEAPSPGAAEEAPAAGKGKKGLPKGKGKKG